MPAVVHVHTRSFYGNLNLHENPEFKQTPEVYGNPRILQENPEFARIPKFTRRSGVFIDPLDFYRVGFINPGLSVPASPVLSV